MIYSIKCKLSIIHRNFQFNLDKLLKKCLLKLLIIKRKLEVGKDKVLIKIEEFRFNEISKSLIAVSEVTLGTY